jgi:hypothetical protein
MNFEVAVVEDIVLDDTSKYFANTGEWNGIGTVTFKKVKGGSYGSRGFAKPYFSNFINYPLRNELVYIFKLPSPDIQTSNLKQVYYYITPLNIWNSNHHNGIPNIFENKDIPESQQRDYVQTELGAVRKVTDNTSDIELGLTFQEKSNIKPLKKFEGDVILEGRLGSSIRLGSTVQKNGTPLNNWSTTNFNGDPIILIRNGQGDKGSVGYLPTEESIDLDLSSIYLTSTQKIPLTVASINYFSYTQNPPTNPDQFTGKQIILNSGRLLFNASEDHLMLSSAKSISLSSNSSVNIDAEELIVQTSNIYLGSKTASEPLLLGDTTTALLDELISIVSTLAEASLQAANSGGPVSSLNQAAPKLLTRLKKLQTAQLKSKYNFTV